MVDGAGRSVAAPLCRGSSFCLFHAVPFSTRPARLTGPVVVIYLDLETTGVDVSRDRVVEIAATQGVDSPHMPGASYAEVVYVPEEILGTAGAQAAARVHGIPDSEIAQGSAFPMSWARFLAFTEAVLNNAIHEASDSSEDASRRVRDHWTIPRAYWLLRTMVTDSTLLSCYSNVTDISYR